jgi:hypothetical protein
MGFVLQNINGKFPVIDFHGQSVVDIGGGPYSLLLKGVNMTKPTVVDPCEFPDWIYARYNAAGIRCIKTKAEDYCDDQYDVGLIYNCLQHTDNPKKIIENMRKMCGIVYLHEWLETPISDGHIHTLHEKDLNEWLEDEGLVGYETWGSVTTPFYYGVFI